MNREQWIQKMTSGTGQAATPDFMPPLTMPAERLVVPISAVVVAIEQQAAPADRAANGNWNQWQP